jgi:mannosyl-3-phosphoglycerate phosphatase
MKGMGDFLIVFTDLDGTLLDHDTYRWDAALEALEVCRGQAVPIILVSSKTRAEMDPLRRQLGLSSPFICENGGGIFFPAEGDIAPPPGTILAENLHVWSLGTPYHRLTRTLKEIRRELGWKMRGFSEMTLADISALTGLDQEQAGLAARREYDEPFILENHSEEKDLSPLFRAARRRDLQITVGGRFFHLFGLNDKGHAVASLIAWYKETRSRVTSMALGDSPNDFSMLKQADYPVLIRSARRFSGLEETIPGLRVSSETGPRGWNTEVLYRLDEMQTI